MTPQPDLDAYFDRIRWGGATTPTLATLAGLLDAHMSCIPFENLDVLLGRGIALDLGRLQDKLVRGRRGGYCFEHVTLFAAVLDALGFSLLRHTARVVLFSPRADALRTHMFLSVALDEGRFVVDPGFGGLAPTAPLPLRDGAEVRVGDEVHWMARDEDVWVLRARMPDRIADCWISPLDRDNWVDFEVGNHYTASHPRSAMVNRLMLRALTADGRISVMNREVTVVRSGVALTSSLADRAALRGLLNDHFGFDLPDVETLRVPAIPEWQ